MIKNFHAQRTDIAAARLTYFDFGIRGIDVDVTSTDALQLEN